MTYGVNIEQYDDNSKIPYRINHTPMTLNEAFDLTAKEEAKWFNSRPKRQSYDMGADGAYQPVPDFNPTFNTIDVSRPPQICITEISPGILDPID